MSEARKTLVFAGVAALLTLGAILSAPRHRASEVFSDEGKAFYPDFTDPFKATSLEVVEFNEALGGAALFKVELKGGRWVIPSHHDYPADAKDRLAKTASLVIGLQKDTFRSGSPQDHESLGVVEPLDEKAGMPGRGKRVTLRDAQNNVLADFIFGRETGEGKGHRFVRVPGQKATYAIKIQADISAKFEDWIETDLLQVAQSAVRRITVDDYKVDEQARAIKREATHHLVRDDSSAPWKIGDLKETEEVNTETMSAMLGALDDLKIVGVRPKPAVLAKEVKANGDLKVKERVTPQLGMALQSLRQIGYFFVPQGDELHMVSNEGDLQVSCDDGIAYTLRFGEILVGAGEAITAGTEDPKKEKPKGAGTENRFLFVIARFDEKLLSPEPAAIPEVKPDPTKKPEEQKAEEEKYKKDKEEIDRKKQEREKKVVDGKKRAQDLTNRFADWYYVISSDSFKKLRLSRTDLVKLKEPPKPPEPPKEEKKPEEKKPVEKPK